MKKNTLEFLSWFTYPFIPI